jgi:hypothetical protein
MRLEDPEHIIVMMGDVVVVSGCGMRVGMGPVGVEARLLYAFSP